MRTLLSVTLIGIFLGGCARSETVAPPVGAVEMLSSPAGPGSAEPHLSTDGDAVVLSWLQRAGDGGDDLLMARLEGGLWDSTRSVAHGPPGEWFVNWADFPSVVAGPGGVLWAHWLRKGSAGGYDYGIRVSHSSDGGLTWSSPWTPHDDGTPTEHGFLSFFPVGTAMGMIWLDGREYAPGPGGEPALEEMTLVFRTATPRSAPSDEIVVDARICDCCVTDAAITLAGPLVVYRNRTEDEIRDIYATRYVDGRWTEGRPVHDDGWHIAGCPVNGPAVSARGSTAAVAWFTGAEGVGRVQVAFSSDAGATFGAPVRVDDGTPRGRVDVVLLDNGSALVSWLERTGEEGGEVRVRRVRPDGASSPSAAVISTSAARGSGFPQMVRAPGGVVFAWTDVAGDAKRVRVARAEVPAP